MIFAIATALMPILAGAIDGFQAYWGARDDPTWETRWRSLDPAERSWLAVVATRREWIARLTDPEEIKLARGRRRQESRRLVNFDLIVVPIFLTAAALTLMGVIGPGILTLVFLAFTTVRGIRIYLRERQIKGALESERKIAAAT